MVRIYRPTMGWENDMRVNVPTCVVIEETPAPSFSGLLDANGNKLMATDRPEPAGFVIFGSSHGG